MSYRTLATLFVGLAAAVTVFYALLFYSGMRLLNQFGITTGGVDAITGTVIQIAAGVPFVLLTAMALAFRKQLVTGAEQGLG